MATFLVASEEDRPDLEAKIAEEFGEEHYVLRKGSQWIVEAEMTTPEVTDALDIRDGTYGRAVVFATSNYFGWHYRSLWEWLELD